MKTSILRFFVLSGFLASMTLFVACNNSGQSEKTNTKDSAEKHNEAKFNKAAEKDAQALVDAYSAGLYEVKLSDSAKKYAVTPQVKSLATALAESHELLNAQIRELAGKKQISLPTDITPEQEKSIVKLTTDKKKIDFDKDFTNEVVSKHKDAVSLFEKCSNECEDADIKAWFTNHLLEIRKHLDMAMAANEKIKAMK